MSKSVIKINRNETIPFSQSIRFNPELSWGQKAFLAEIQDQTKRGKFYYHKPSLANFFNVAQVTIFQWVKDMCEKKLIEVIFDPCDNVCKTHIVVKKDI